MLYRLYFLVQRANNKVQCSKSHNIAFVDFDVKVIYVIKFGVACNFLIYSHFPVMPKMFFFNNSFWFLTSEK